LFSTFLLGSGVTNGAAMLEPKTGGAMVVVGFTFDPSSDVSPRHSLAVDQTNVYWTNQDDGTVVTAPK